MNGQSPTTPTTPDGLEKINRSQHQGNIINDGITDRVILGFQKDGFGTGVDFGIKVSQAGVDVKTAADDELVMSSAFNLFKIVASGTGTLTAGAAGTSVYTDIPHSLGYQPAFLCFGYPPNTSQFWGAGYNQQFPVTFYALSGGYFVLDSFMHAQVTTSDLRIAVTRASSSSASAAGTWTYKYYILSETAI